MVTKPSIAIITGACGGVGQACARRLGRSHVLVLTDRDRASLDQEAQALRGAGMRVATALAGDIIEPRTVDCIVEAAAGAGDLTALVHAAGVSPSMGDWRTMLRVNLLATELVSAGVLARAAPGVVAVMIASVASQRVPPDDAELNDIVDHPLAEDFLTRFEPFVAALPIEVAPSSFAYAASKYGVLRHVRRRVRDYAAKGGRIMAVSPGLLDTAMGRMALSPGSDGAQLLAAAPLGRLGQADEIAAVAAFLISEAASFATGADWVVDGGATAQ